MPWRRIRDGQAVVISTFPEHLVRRRPWDKAWILQNENVVLWSVDSQVEHHHFHTAQTLCLKGDAMVKRNHLRPAFSLFKDMVTALGGFSSDDDPVNADLRMLQDPHDDSGFVAVERDLLMTMAPREQALRTIAVARLGDTALDVAGRHQSRSHARYAIRASIRTISAHADLVPDAIAHLAYVRLKSAVTLLDDDDDDDDDSSFDLSDLLACLPGHIHGPSSSDSLLSAAAHPSA